MATGSLNANGIWIYGEDDSEATFSALLNKLGNSTSNQIAIVKSSGRVIQVQHVDKLNGFTSSTTSSYVDITGLSVSITPKFSTSKILVEYNIGSISSTGSSVMSARIVRNTTNIGNGSTATPQTSNSTAFTGATGDKWTNLSGRFMDSPATTSAITYKIQGFSSATAWSINRFVSADQWGAISSITVMEIAA